MDQRVGRYYLRLGDKVRARVGVRVRVGGRVGVRVGRYYLRLGDKARPNPSPSLNLPPTLTPIRNPYPYP